MKILRSWLQDYIDLDSTKLSNADIADRLALSGTAVEEVIDLFDDQVIVTQITKIEPHPNADRLRLTTVNNGSNEQTVVCGAPNIEVGQKVPLAQLGAVLPGNFEIKKAIIRGVESEGMLCAADELGLGDDHNGIIILPESYELGRPFRDYLKTDAVFDLEITANRGDCLSHLGVARELSAILDLPLKNTDLNIPDQSETPSSKFSVDITTGIDGCHRYDAIGINNVSIAPSSDLIQQRLIALGAKPINNVVDASNYILLDMGHPTHAFDADKIVGDKIIVRFATDAEEIVTLDGTKRTLKKTDLVIADQDKAIALAGIMGCENSIVDENTKNIILESARFNPIIIRTTAKRLGMSTDASYRFERGVDRAGADAARSQLTALILQLAGGEYTDRFDAISDDFEKIKVEIPYDKINGLIGINISKFEIDHILKSLGFDITDDHFSAVPLWRNDIAIWQDLAEEVARIYGYNNIPRVEMPVSTPPAKSPYYYKEHLKDLLVDLGFSEIYGYTFLSGNDLKTLNISSENLLEVSNPVQIENKYMKSSLLPNLMRAIAKNPTFDPVAIFEIGQVFTKDTEDSHFAIATSGKNAKKMIESAQNTIADDLQINPTILPIRELSRDDLLRYKIKKPVTYVIEVDLNIILDKIKIDEEKLTLHLPDKKVIYRTVSKFPSLTRDLAFIVDNTTDADQVANEIYDFSDLIGRVELFDEFTSDKFGTGKKNIAYHLYLQHIDRTLTDAEANELIDNLIKQIASKFGGELRDK